MLSETSTLFPQKKKVKPGIQFALGPIWFIIGHLLYNKSFLEENDLMLETAISSLSCIDAERVNCPP